MESAERNYKLIKIFLTRILEVRELQAEQDANLLVSILSRESIRNLEFSIQQKDMIRCGGTVCCEKCTFREIKENDAEVINTAGCEYIHPGCRLWQ